VNPGSVKASYETGALKVELEKRVEAKPKQIKVEVGRPMQVEAGKKEVKTAALRQPVDALCNPLAKTRNISGREMSSSRIISRSEWTELWRYGGTDLR
jgi:hypothetical protein